MGTESVDQGFICWVMNDFRACAADPCALGPQRRLSQMNTPQEEHSPTGKRADRKEHWLPLLEQELKQRVGWADEAISPFARRNRAPKVKPIVRRAA